jgi:hypothetical protein
LAAVVAARAAQTNRYSFDWDVSYGALPNSKNSSIIIGTYAEIARFAPIAQALQVAPVANGFKINGRVRVVQDALKNGAVLQAVRAPGSDTAVLYVLMGENDEALNRFARLLSDPKRVIGLTGEVAVLTADGELITLGSRSDQQINENRTTEQDRYTPQMLGLMGLILAVFVVLIVIFARQFIKRTPKDA